VVDCGADKDSVAWLKNKSEEKLGKRQASQLKINSLLAFSDVQGGEVEEKREISDDGSSEERSRQRQ
jgi:hypothetical protein